MIRAVSADEVLAYRDVDACAATPAQCPYRTASDWPSLGVFLGCRASDGKVKNRRDPELCPVRLHALGKAPAREE